MFFVFFTFFPLGKWLHQQESTGLPTLINLGYPVVKTKMVLGIKERENRLVQVTTAFVEYLVQCPTLV